MAQRYVQKQYISTSTVNSRIHISLFLTIALIIITMGIVQYKNINERLEKAYENHFIHTCNNLDKEIGEIHTYIARLLHQSGESFTHQPDSHFLSHLLQNVASVSTYIEVGDFHVIKEDTQIAGYSLQGTLSGSERINNKDLEYAQKIHMTLSLLPSQIAMHTSNQSITLSYFISSHYDLVQTYPSIPIRSLTKSYPGFIDFQKFAFQVYDNVAPESINPDRKIFWTTPYIDRAGNGMMVTCGAPIYKKDSYEGVIGADVVLDFLDRYTHKDLNLPGKLYLITQSGDILSATGLQYKADSDLKQISDMTSLSLDEILHMKISNTQNPMIRKLHHAPWIFIYTPDKKEIQQAAFEEFTITGISIILILFLLPIGYFFIRTFLIAPALKAEASLAEMTSELDHKVHLRTKELLEREENLRITLDSIGDAVIVCNNTGIITRINPVAMQLIACTADEAIGKRLTSIFKVVHSDSDIHMNEELHSMIHEGKHIDLNRNIELMSRDGNKHYIAYSGAPIKNSADELIGTILVFRDISDEIMMQKKLQNLRNYLTNIIDSMPSILIGVNVNNKVTQWNKTTAQITGITYEEAHNKLLFDLLPSLVNRQAPLKESILTKKVYKESGTGLFESISIQHDELTIYPLTGKMIQGAVIRIDDISEKVALEAQLHQSRKMDAIGQLSGGIAHDFNNMLSGVLASAEMLQLDLEEADEEILSHIDVIMQATLQASDLSKKLLTFGRKEKIEKKPLDVVPLVEETLAILRRTIDKKIEIIFQNNTHESWISGDASPLQNVFINLGINASHAMPSGGSLSFTLANKVLRDQDHEQSEQLPAGTYIQIKVIDTGIGIKAEYLEKIFEPFFTTKEVGKGTGLGLSAAYGTIKDHGGTITVESQSGEGTTFSILLPCSAAKRTHDDSSQDIIKGSGTILVVDDEVLIQFTTRKMLERMGYEVFIAQNGLEAVELFKEHHSEIALTIMDMLMPKMNGREALRLFKEIDPTCRVILSSGFARKEQLADIQSNGLLGFIPKPYKSSELSKLLHSVLTDDEEQVQEV